MSQVITLSDAAALSNNELVEGIIADIITVDEWFKYLPFVVFEGLAYTFTREKALASADFAVPGINLAKATTNFRFRFLLNQKLLHVLI